jgi:hypothetical protein
MYHSWLSIISQTPSDCRFGTVLATTQFEIFDFSTDEFTFMPSPQPLEWILKGTIAMTKNTGKNYRKGSVTDRTQTETQSGNHVKRDASTGEFMDVKTSDESKFKGVAEEPDDRRSGSSNYKPKYKDIRNQVYQLRNHRSSG